MSYRAWIYLQHLLYFLGISHTLAFTVISERINTKKQSLRGVIVLFCPGSTKNKYCCSEVSQSYPSKGANFPLLPLSNLKKSQRKIWYKIQTLCTVALRPELDGVFQTKDATGWHEWRIVQILLKRCCQTLKPPVVILVRIVATLDLSHSPHPAITTSVRTPSGGVLHHARLHRPLKIRSRHDGVQRPKTIHKCRLYQISSDWNTTLLSTTQAISEEDSLEAFG